MRIRIIFDANEEYRKKLKMLAAEKGTTVNQIIYDAIKKTYGINPPNTEKNK
jgi:acyl carrier protein